MLLPVIAPGCAMLLFGLTLNVCAVLLPQVLLAVTLMVPPFAPAVALMLVDVDVPVQPFGNVHV